MHGQVPFAIKKQLGSRNIQSPLLGIGYLWHKIDVVEAPRNSPRHQVDSPPCRFTYRVLQFQTGPAVVVEAQDGVEHRHEKDPDYLADRTTDGPFYWSQEMTTIVQEGLVSGLSTGEIKKLLLSSGLFTSAKFPTKTQLNNKINHVNRVFDLRPKLQRFQQPSAASTGRTRGRPRMPKNRYVPFLEK